MACNFTLSAPCSILSPRHSPAVSYKSKPSLSFNLYYGKTPSSHYPCTSSFKALVAEGPVGLEAERSESSSISFVNDADKLAALEQKIRIKLRSYWVPLIEDSCKMILEAARTTNSKTMGPVPLPTHRRVFCLLKSPNGHKDARFHIEIRTHIRLIDILHPTAETIDSLMKLDIPCGVDVEVKL